MKNLGKIIFLTILVPLTLFGNVTATVEPNTVTVGDTATLNLSISGNDIKQPQITTLCGTDILSTGSRTNIKMINGNYSRSYILSYQFAPIKDCVIKPIEVEIDGAVQKSNAINVKVKAFSRDKNSHYILDLESAKKDVLVGEPFEVTLIFKQKKDASIANSQFFAPEFKGFWKKGESKPIQYIDGNFVVTKVIYTIAAQRVGELNIKPASIKIATRVNNRDMFGMWMQSLKWKSYSSNGLKVDVKALPLGVNLVGNFTINATADKSEINSNEALNVLVTIKGNGNLEDVKTLKPYIEGVSVFDEKIVIVNSLLSQKMAFVADADFTIPPFSIKYYDLKTKTIKTISTKEIKIKVKSSKAKKELTIKRQEEKKSVNILQVSKNSISYIWLMLALAVGLFSGIIIMILKPWKFFAKEKSLDIKNYKVLLMKFLPFKSDDKVQNIVDILEKNIYSNEKIKIDKKVLKEIIKKYDIY